MDLELGLDGIVDDALIDFLGKRHESAFGVISEVEFILMVAKAQQSASLGKRQPVACTWTTCGLNPCSTSATFLCLKVPVTSTLWILAIANQNNPIVASTKELRCTCVRRKKSGAAYRGSSLVTLTSKVDRMRCTLHLLIMGDGTACKKRPDRRLSCSPEQCMPYPHVHPEQWLGTEKSNVGLLRPG